MGHQARGDRQYCFAGPSLRSGFRLRVLHPITRKPRVLGAPGSNARKTAQLTNGPKPCPGPAWPRSAPTRQNPARRGPQ